MLKNYIYTAVRTILRNKLFSLVNIIGLSLGIVSCLFIYVYIADEISFDRHHKLSGSTYRIQSFFLFNDVEDKFGISSFPTAPFMASEFPEITSYTRLFVLGAINCQHQDETFYMDNAYLADSGFFKIFDFDFIYGSPEQCLNKPYQIVLTENQARQFFGRENPLGKVIHWNQKNLKVSGVIRSDGVNTHVVPGGFISMSSMNPVFRKQIEANWTNNNSYSYVVIPSPEAATALERKLEGFVSRHILPEFNKFGFKGTIELHLEPLKDIHFNNYLIYDTPVKGNRAYIYIFSVVAVLILIVACVNYMNLSTAAAIKRAREIAIRKVSGALRKNIATQFILESLLITFLAAIISLALMEIMLPFFNFITDKSMDMRQILNPAFSVILMAMIMVIGLISGSYPAIFLSRFSPQIIFKDYGTLKGNSGRIRKALVTGQFAIALFMITGTLAIYAQIAYMKSKDLGFRKENMVAIEMRPGARDSTFFTKVLAVRNEINQLKDIRKSAMTGSLPGQKVSRIIFSFNGANGKENKPLASTDFDGDYAELMHIPVIEGRSFDISLKSDLTHSVLVNESAVKFLGWKNPLSEKLILPAEGKNPEQELKVIGVVKDFHFASLHAPIEPLIIFQSDPKESAGYLVLDIEPGATATTLKKVETSFKKHIKGKNFQAVFLEESLKEQYAADEKMMNVFGYFSLLAIIISCLGLYGLATFSTRQRTRELGIRKVLGANLKDLLLLINREFIVLVCLAFLLSCPLIYFSIKIWLKNFAYQSDINFWYFLFAWLLTMGITVLTVSVQAWKVAGLNPVTSLRYE